MSIKKIPVPQPLTGKVLRLPCRQTYSSFVLKTTALIDAIHLALAMQPLYRMALHLSSNKLVYLHNILIKSVPETVREWPLLRRGIGCPFWSLPVMPEPLDFRILQSNTQAQRHLILRAAAKSFTKPTGRSDIKSTVEKNRHSKDSWYPPPSKKILHSQTQSFQSSRYNKGTESLHRHNNRACTWRASRYCSKL